MSFLLLPLSLLLLFFLLRLQEKQVTPLPVTWIRAVLLWSALIVIGSEGLSLTKSFGFRGMILWWSSVMLVLLIPAIVRRRQLPAITDSLQEIVRAHLKNGFRPYLVVLLVFLALLLVQGLIYPPNTYDSMTYHLARIVHWIGNGSLSHYPTHIIRQLYQPPFAELAIAHAGLLAGSDLPAAAIQWLFLCSTLPVVYQISRELGLTRNAAWFSMLLVITLPMAVLQGSSTQNDLVVAFFIAATTLFCIRSLHSGKTIEVVFAALAAGLALLTKGTAYLFLAPLLLGWFIWFIFRYGRHPSTRVLLQPLLLGMIPLMLNAGHYTRNYRMNGQPLGVTGAEAESYQNKRHTAGVLLSNILRNGSLHLAVPLLNEPTEQVVRTLHEMTGLAADDPASTFPYVDGYELRYYATLEDHGGNVIQFLLFILALVMTPFLSKSRSRAMLAYLTLLLLQMLLFCGWLNWQPWHARLHTPVFILAAPFIAWATTRILLPVGMMILSALLVIYATMVLTFNYARPVIPVNRYTAEVTPCGDRFNGQFALKPYAREEYRTITRMLDSAGIRNPGLILGGDAWEYPLFRNAFTTLYHPAHLEVNNDSRRTSSSDPLEVPCIISDRKTAEIKWEGKRYRCITPQHNTLFYYNP